MSIQNPAKLIWNDMIWCEELSIQEMCFACNNCMQYLWIRWTSNKQSVLLLLNVKFLLCTSFFSLGWMIVYLDGWMDRRTTTKKKEEREIDRVKKDHVSFLATFDVTLVPYFFPVCFYLVFVCLKLLLLITITTLYFITFKPTTRHESYILCAVFYHYLG